MAMAAVARCARTTGVALRERKRPSTCAGRERLMGCLWSKAYPAEMKKAPGRCGLTGHNYIRP